MSGAAGGAGCLIGLPQPSEGWLRPAIGRLHCCCPLQGLRAALQRGQVGEHVPAGTPRLALLHCRHILARHAAWYASTLEPSQGERNWQPAATRASSNNCVLPPNTSTSTLPHIYTRCLLSIGGRPYTNLASPEKAWLLPSHEMASYRSRHCQLGGHCCDHHMGVCALTMAGIDKRVLLSLVPPLCSLLAEKAANVSRPHQLGFETDYDK